MVSEDMAGANAVHLIMKNDADERTVDVHSSIVIADDYFGIVLSTLVLGTNGEGCAGLSAITGAGVTSLS